MLLRLIARIDAQECDRMSSTAGFSTAVRHDKSQAATNADEGTIRGLELGPTPGLRVSRWCIGVVLKLDGAIVAVDHSAAAAALVWCRAIYELVDLVAQLAGNGGQATGSR